MNSLLDWEWSRVRVRTLARHAAALLALFSAVAAARGDTTNFTGDFQAAFWANSPVGLGSANFTNANTELVLTGPNAPASEQTSLDGIVYNGPLSGGLAVGGTVEFSWSYDSGDALSTSEADLAWLVPGGGSPMQQLLAQGGPGVAMSGTFTTPALPAGTVFQFLLTTDTLANKTSGTLVVSDFVFRPDIPEPSSGMLLFTAALGFGLARMRHSRAGASHTA